MLGTMVSLGTALAVTVVMPQSAGLAGLALTAALNLTGILNWSVRQSTDLEIQMNRWDFSVLIAASARQFVPPCMLTLNATFKG